MTRYGNKYNPRIEPIPSHLVLHLAPNISAAIYSVRSQHAFLAIIIMYTIEYFAHAIILMVY